MNKSYLLFNYIKLGMLFLFLFGIMSCRSDDTGFEAELKIAIQSAFESDPPRLAMNNATSFEWDQLFIFGPYTAVNDIEKALGIGLPQVKDSGIEMAETFCILVFLSKKSIAKYYELNRSHGDFSSLSSLSPYTVSQASFIVTSDESGWIKISKE